LNTDTYSHKVLYTIGVIVLAAVIILLFVEAVQVMLLIFAGILLAVFLRGIASFISSRTDVSPAVALGIVLLASIILITGGIWLLGPNIAEGFNRMKDQIPTAWNHLRDELSKSDWGRSIVQGVQNAGQNITTDSDMITRISGIFSSTFGAIVNIFIILVIGLYSAFSPGLYINSAIKLIPPRKRQRAGEVLRAMNNALKWWFVGRIASMLIIGILTAIGLWILGIPMPVTLGIFAALLTFVPNLGPVVSAVPAVLFGLVISPMKGLWVVILYVGIQTLESYLITPQIQKKAVSIPPALLISAQILIGVLLGIFGLILATPMMVCVIVAVQMLYIEDTLGDEVKVLGDGHSLKS
jgi:predicted PurR-regulated permease PerM